MKLEHFVEIGTGFYNYKTAFNVGVCITINIGTQISLLRLKSTGKFLVLDTCALSTAAKREFDLLTDNGSLVEAVIATHPFHTTYFESFYKLYPTPDYYGTPRHLRNIKSIPWKGVYNIMNFQIMITHVYVYMYS
jgi:hypothetical protein